MIVIFYVVLLQQIKQIKDMVLVQEINTNNMYHEIKIFFKPSYRLTD